MSAHLAPVKAALRRATSADATRLADILVATRATFMVYAPLAHSEAEVREWVREYLVPTGKVTVEECDGEVKGLVAISNDGQYCWIDQMYVHPSHVSQGIGSRLLAHVISTSALPIRLYTFQANAGARRFYERYDFRAVHFTDGQANEEHCPDVLYERSAQPKVEA